MLPTLLLAGILAVLNPVFAHIGVEEGLSQTTVLSIAQVSSFCLNRIG